MGLMELAHQVFAKFLETAAASVDDGPTGGWSLFVDTDGFFKQKDETGAVRFIGDMAKVAYLDLITGAAPSNPAAGHVRIYSKTGDDLGWRDPGGTEHLLTAFPGYATPTVTLGTAHAAGTALTALRSDATILTFDVTDPEALAFGNTADDGNSTTAARRNHRHLMPAQQAANADTSGATLGDLETEVNEIKAALRAAGIIAT